MKSFYYTLYPFLLFFLSQGIPAITVPAGLSSRGLPLGLQFIGQAFCEQQLLSVAKWFEKQMDFCPLEFYRHLENAKILQSNIKLASSL